MVGAVRIMNLLRERKLSAALMVAGGLAISLSAQTLNIIGVTALRSVATNLNGAGIRVAQPEASLTIDNLTWQVNPAFVSQPTNLFTYYSSSGSSNAYPNSLGVESGHAGEVGRQFYSPVYGVATNVAQVDNYEANHFINDIVDTAVAIPASIVNQSFADPDTNSQAAYDTIYDNYAAQYRTLFISGAGNDARVEPPSTCYNGISVGAYWNGVNVGGVGPTPNGGRCKPDITAPNVYTSYTTPLVSGVAALLAQAGVRGDGGGDTNSATDMRVLKALLLNGAVKPVGWTNGAARPLDARFGAGFLNALNSYVQLTGGKQNYIVTNKVSLNAAHPPTGDTGTVAVLSGWNFSTNVSGRSNSPGSQNDTIHHYYFNVSNVNSVAKFTATATLVWNRQQSQSAINNLNLFLYDCANSNLVMSSTSAVDNVEHLYITNLAQGRYDLQVWKAGGNNAAIVSAAEPYALAWEFVPPPVLALTNGAGKALQWSAYPAAFVIESRTNLLAGSWSTNGFGAPAITNGVNSIPLSTTNAVRFFRLKQWRP